MVLLSLWEARTFLGKSYNIGTSRHGSKAKVLAKGLNTAPLKTQGVHGDKFWDGVDSHMKALQNEEIMARTCRSLVELMNVDKEFKVANEDDWMAIDEHGTPSKEEVADAPHTRRKRKAGATPGGRKKRARSTPQPGKRRYRARREFSCLSRRLPHHAQIQKTKSST
ncbi:Sister chromatid cohesion protein 2 [Purpureocillium takamizusanense]|uniref:Sister chromatid cohesion protein 2 n=1 Tax=Purpureocillium takamizusanense TaxID=2060973 RepID=A0A9Q8V9S7_9HYPO|nr:Sister chromatid cohesion protein 2 [Purpureocillium takamizusanense]UNI17164.1 Sister chromatid cohesion protein 2 [Purpureocillium takamizusanense]